MRRALFWETSGDGAVCGLCPHRCQISEGETGRCGVRRVREGELLAESWGRVTSLALDPTLKKPLHRFHPGSWILSVGSYGCNLRCPFCQNHRISMEEAEWKAVSPEELVELSLSLVPRGNIGVAFTYNEPLIGYEYLADASKLLRSRGQKVVLVTNGYIEREPLARLLPGVDAVNIDLKGFAPDAYDWLGGEIGPVKETIALAAESCHVEVTTLVVPGRNDGEEEIRALARWLAGVNRDIPLHISRYFPRHRTGDIPATPVEAVFRLAEVAREHLTDVIPGNV